MNENRLLGIGLRIGAASCGGVMLALIKLGHEIGINTAELIFYRFALALLPLLAWMTITGNLGAWRTRRPVLLLGCGVVGMVFSALSYLAVTLLPLAEATTIGFAAPLFAVALSALLMGERVGVHRWCAVAFGFAGMLIVMQPSGSDLPRLGLIFAVLSAAVMGASAVQLRYVGRTQSAITTTFWCSIFISAVSALFLPQFAQRHDMQQWLLLFALGISGGLAQLLLTASVRFAPVAAVVPFDYVQLIWAALLGWIFWATRPPATTWAGAVVIVASGLYAIYREQRSGRDVPTGPSSLMLRP